MKKFNFIKKHKNNSNKKYANKRNVHKKINAQKKVKKGNLKTKPVSYTHLSLPEVEDKDLPDLLSTTVVEQGTESAKVKFVINKRAEKAKRA